MTFLEADMADNFTHFSCVLDVGTPDNAARALDLYPVFMEKAAREGGLFCSKARYFRPFTGRGLIGMFRPRRGPEWPFSRLRSTA